jgi:hypothetical protein
MRQLVHIRLEADTLARVKTEADRLDLSIAEFIRQAVEKALPGRAEISAPAPIGDPVLEALASGIRREAESRGLSEKMIVQLWLNMMRPALPPKSVTDSLRLNKDRSPEEPPK